MNQALIDGDEIALRAAGRIGIELEEKWTLQRILGIGGMAAVYAAQHRNQSRVAIKMLHAHFSADRAIRDRFLTEGYAGNSIDHRGVVRVLDDGLAPDGSAFVVMDMLEGQSLEQLLLNVGRLEPVHAVDFGIQASEILHAAHLKGVVHRDIKPDNFFITVEGEVKLLDFGIARVNAHSSSTTIGSFMGTPAYASPEQAKGKWSEVDWQSDLWSLAATLFTTLTGQQVHVGETSMEQLARAVTDTPRSIESTGVDLPEDLCALINQALHPDKDKRFTNIAAWLKGLYSVEAALPLPERDLGELCNEVLENCADTDTLVHRSRSRRASNSQLNGALRDSETAEASRQRRSLRPPSTGRRRRSRGGRVSDQESTEPAGTQQATRHFATETKVQESERSEARGLDEDRKSAVTAGFPWLVATLAVVVAVVALFVLALRVSQDQSEDESAQRAGGNEVTAASATSPQNAPPPLAEPGAQPESTPIAPPEPTSPPEATKTTQQAVSPPKPTPPPSTPPKPRSSNPSSDHGLTTQHSTSLPRPVPTPPRTAPHSQPKPAPNERELMLKGRH